MSRFFKHEAESWEGWEGMAYLEISDGWPVRQVEVYGEVWTAGDEEHNEFLADQPFEVLGLEKEHEIRREEFEAIWNEAMKRCPFDS